MERANLNPAESAPGRERRAAARETPDNPVIVRVWTGGRSGFGLLCDVSSSGARINLGGESARALGPSLGLGAEVSLSLPAVALSPFGRVVRAEESPHQVEFALAFSRQLQTVGITGVFLAAAVRAGSFGRSVP